MAGETVLAFEYYELYRDMPDRTLRKLTHIPVRGKTRDLKSIGRWSSRFRWKERVRAFDNEKNRLAAQEIIARQQAEIEAFIEADLQIARDIQEMTLQHLMHIKETKTRDAAEMRKLVFTHSTRYTIEITTADLGPNKPAPRQKSDAPIVLDSQILRRMRRQTSRTLSHQIGHAFFTDDVIDDFLRNPLSSRRTKFNCS